MGLHGALSERASIGFDGLSTHRQAIKPVPHWLNHFRRRMTSLTFRNLSNGHPRIFNITESAHRIHNPITPEKLATLGAALRLEPAARVLDLGSGSGRCCALARDHGVTGTGVDLGALFSEQAISRAAELGVTDQVSFIHGDAAGYVAADKVAVAACIGATWIGGGVAGTIALLARSLRPGGVILIGEPTGAIAADGGCCPRVPGWRNFRLSHAAGTARLLPSSGLDVVEMVLADQDAGTDTRRPNGSPCVDGKANPGRTGQGFVPDWARNPALYCLHA